MFEGKVLVDLTGIKKRDHTSNNLSLAIKVFDEHGDFIRTAIRFHLRNNAEAEDLFQDFFLFLATKSLPEEIQNVRGFLYRVLSDKIKDFSRRTERYQEKIRRYAEHLECISENCPDDIVAEVEESRKMFELIQRNLPPKEAQAVTLRYRNGFEVGEVAEKMNIESRTISRYVSVGLKKLRHVFAFYGDNNYDSF